VDNFIRKLAASYVPVLVVMKYAKIV